MFPATNAGAGGNVGFPDVCLTPAAPSPIPVPYPNMSTNAQTTGFVANVTVTSVPLNNMMSAQAMTNGMNSGAAHPPGIMKKGGYTMGNPMIQANGLPAQHLLMPTNGNAYNNPAGATLIPSAVNVMFCSATAATVTDAVESADDPWARALTGAEVDALQSLLGEVDDVSAGFTPMIGHDESGALRMIVVHVRRRTLAAAAGLQPGDEITAIDGVCVDDPASLRFPVGTDVTFTVRRDDCTLALRATQPVPERRAAIAADEVVDGLGRVEILRFHDDLPRQVANAMRCLTAAGATHFEFDLCNCPGGDLAAALLLADDFLPAGLALVTVSRDGIDTPHCTRRAQRYTRPLTLRVNSQTASAAEIFVACLVQHDRATVIGGPMMGKLSGQTVTGSAVRTVATISCANSR